ncbi:MAG: DUF3592 domain-containing protein [Desulfamplus sp.]|nr:DUF3592 domain-containing protein [Desulfamplus sp.]
MICDICVKIGFKRNFKYLNYIIVTNIIRRGFNPCGFGGFNPDAYIEIKKIVENSKVDWNVCHKCVERLKPYLDESEQNYLNKKTKTEKFNKHEIKKLFASPIIFLILIFVCGGATVLFLQTRGFIWAKLSVDWPVAQGRVISSWVERHHDLERGTSFEAKVAYEYIVEGVPFEGNRIFFGKAGSSHLSTEEEIVSIYPAGKSVHVYYKPGNPEVCLLEPGKTGKSKLLIVFGMIFLFAGLFLVATRKLWIDND